MKKILATLLIQCLFITSVFAAGKLQDADFKTEAQLITAGATKSSLLNDSKVYITANGINDRLDNAITNGQIGGSPAGSVNLLNGGFENGTTGWATYKNTAQALPVNGTGGSPTSTLTQTTTNPLYGKGSGVMSHPASNVQGEGISYDFTIDQGLQAKVLTLQGSYRVLTGTYSGGTSSTDSDVEAYIYDKTNSVLIQPTAFKLDGGGIVGQNYNFNATFQSASNSTSYRIIFHYPNVTATAFTLALDIAGISSVVAPQGAIITSPLNMGTIIATGTSSNPTKGTVVTDKVMGNRVGARLVVDYQYEQSAGGANGSGDTLIALPGGLSFDSSSVVFSTNSSATSVTNPKSIVGYGFASNNGSSYTSGILVAYDSTHFRVLIAAAGAPQFLNPATTAGFGGAMGLGLHVDAPILGWSSTQTLSSDAGQRIVAMRATATSGAAGSPTIFSTKTFDTHNGYSTSTGLYTVPEAGYYHVSAMINTSANNGGTCLYIWKNGANDIPLHCYSTDLASYKMGSGSGLVYANVGDTLGVAGLSSTMTSAFMSIEKVQSPTQIAASETVAASYWLSANFTASLTTPINFDSKEYDTHGSVTTSPTAWKFTAPAPGLYNVVALADNNATSIAFYQLNKNGSKYYGHFGNTSGTDNGYGNIGNVYIRLNAGDYIDIRPGVSMTVRGGALSVDNAARIQITRVGL